MTSITNMVMPKIEREAEARNYGKFVISPLERGYGVTLGNALRRVLLSSLEGAAVTSIRIADVLHEFSEIPGVREDVIQVTLQVKQLRLKLDGVDTTRMHLEVRGEGTVTAADIITPAEVEVVNPDCICLRWITPRPSLIWNSQLSAVADIHRPMSAAGICQSVNCRSMRSTARSNV